jgi:aminoglycoside phosphotransferase (APT) family kinase protein
MIQKIGGGISVPRRRVDFPTTQGPAAPIAKQTRLANPTLASDVARVLADYLLERLEGSIAYKRLPVEFTEGWETHTYAFQLDGGSLPAAYELPLVLRIYPYRESIPRARHEFAVLEHLFGRGFPVTAPLFLEENCRYFGGPFLIRAEAPGQTLFKAMLQRPRRLWTGPRQMAALQARLHQLPVDGFPNSPESLLTRSLEQIADDIRSAGWRGLVPGLDWLVEHAPPSPAASRILHLDFHPINLIRQENGVLVPIDWTEADVGDPHADVATSLVLAECTPPKDTTLLDRAGVGVGRLFFVRWYLRAYRRHLPIDWNRLAYYRAWAALRRLCRYGDWLEGGSGACVCKASAAQKIQPRELHILEDYFEKRTGVSVHTLTRRASEVPAYASC